MRLDDDAATSRRSIAARAAQELRPGEIVNLGIGIPNLIPGLLGDDAERLPADRERASRHGAFSGRHGSEGDPELINAGKKAVTALPGGGLFHHADSFTMIRGGHIDVCVLGAMQVSARGDLAN